MFNMKAVLVQFQNSLENMKCNLEDSSLYNRVVEVAINEVKSPLKAVCNSQVHTLC